MTLKFILSTRPKIMWCVVKIFENQNTLSLQKYSTNACKHLLGIQKAKRIQATKVIPIPQSQEQALQGVNDQRKETMKAKSNHVRVTKKLNIYKIYMGGPFILHKMKGSCWGANITPTKSPRRRADRFRALQ